MIYTKVIVITLIPIMVYADKDILVVDVLRHNIDILRHNIDTLRHNIDIL